MKKSTWLVMLMALTLAAGCSPDDAGTPAPVAATATPPAPTTPPEDCTPTATPPPFTFETPAVIIEPPVLIPTVTTTPPPVNLPEETLILFSPGPGSQLASPFTVAGFGGPSLDDVVHLRLLGEGGSVLAERDGYLLVLPGNPGRFYAEMNFSVDLVGEEGRLEVSMRSPLTGNLSHITTVDLVLLSTGLARVRTALAGPERLTLLSPPAESRIEGHRVLVSGVGWTQSSRPLSIEVRDINGTVLGSTQAEVVAPSVGQLGTFEAELTYDASYPQWGTIVVAETSATGIPGIIHLASVDVWLSP